MAQLLGLVILSFLVTSLVIVPFIDLLYYLRHRFLRRVDSEQASLIVSAHDRSDTPIHDKLMKADFGTPHGGGIVIIPIVVIISGLVMLLRTNQFSWELGVLVLSMISFGLLGSVDDIGHITQTSAGKFKGLSGKKILPIQVLLGLIVALVLYFPLGFNNIYIPVVGNIVLGWIYIPLAVFSIVAFANAVNISDGLDGLSTGLLTICLVAFLVLAHSVFDLTLSVFVGVWLGAVIAYLYFNVYPARVYLGDAGSFGFGATLAVIGLLTGKIIALGFIGGVYVVILMTSLIQILSKRFLHRKAFPLAPLHMYFKYIGWPEPKIVSRFWLAGAMFAMFGLWLALAAK